MSMKLALSVLVPPLAAVLYLSGCAAHKAAAPEEEQYFSALDTLPRPTSEKSKERESFERELARKDSIIAVLREGNHILQDTIDRLQGRPEPKPQIILEKGKTVILGGITFATSSARLKPESEATLEQLHAALAANDQLVVEIAGYTDNHGKEGNNKKLSLARAQAVKDWLVKKGVRDGRLSVVGMGSSDPIGPNTNSAGRAKNRRIEFHVQ
jgi:outer membrane protein OmpA-like peptidoglycan-associated protein